MNGLKYTTLTNNSAYRCIISLNNNIISSVTVHSWYVYLRRYLMNNNGLYYGQMTHDKYLLLKQICRILYPNTNNIQYELSWCLEHDGF